MTDTDFLRLALAEAEKGRGKTAPNPAVGALVVKEGKILAKGYHQGPGTPHAEVIALQNLKDTAHGATLYVTLEPCCHWGRTPPCTDLILQHKIGRVVYGYQDPNPKVAGKGIEQLASNGVQVEHGALPETQEFYRSYHHWHQTGLPYVTAKLALSLDGKYALTSNQPFKFTSEVADTLTHQMRLRSDAILTTAKTIACDDPQLNARINGEIIKKPVYVLEKTTKVPRSARIFNTAQKVIPCADIAQIGKDGVQDLWVEAGATLIRFLLKNHLIHELWLYYTPHWLGDKGRAAFENEDQLYLEKSVKKEWISLSPDSLLRIKYQR